MLEIDITPLHAAQLVMNVCIITLGLYISAVGTNAICSRVSERRQNRKRHSQGDVFISYSRDMRNWATRIQDEVKLFDSKTSYSEKTVFNYGDIDPATVTSGTNWQERIGRPTRSGATLVVILLGERIGRPLDANFSDRHSISDRLKKQGYNWIHVAGKDKGAPSADQVPLTGVLYELMDVWLARLENNNPPDLQIILSGKFDHNSGPDWGSRRWRRDLLASNISSQDTDQQIQWLNTLHKNFLNDGGMHICNWVDSTDVLKEHIGTYLGEAFREKAISLRNVGLPGLSPFSREHIGLYQPDKTVRSNLVQAVFESRKDRNLIILKGDTNSGKSSLLLAGLDAELRQQHRKNLKYHCVVADVAKLGDNDPLRWFGMLLANTEYPSTINSDVQTIAGHLAERGDSDTALKNLEFLQSSNKHKLKSREDISSKIVIVVDHLEIAIDQAVNSGERQGQFKLFIELLAKAGGAHARTSAATRTESCPVELIIVTAITTHHYDEFKQGLNGAQDVLPVADFITPDTAIAIIQSTFKALEIGVENKALSDLREITVNSFVGRSGLMPLVSVALQRLQSRWVALGRPANLNNETVLEFGRLDGAIAALGEEAWAVIEPRPQEIRKKNYRVIESDNQDARLTASENCFNDLMWKLVEWDSRKNQLDLRSVFGSYLKPAEKDMSRTLHEKALLRKSGRDTFTLVHEMVVTAWPRAADWLKGVQDDLEEQERLVSKLGELVVAEACGHTEEVTQLLNPAPTAFKRAFDLYARRGKLLHLKAQDLITRYLNEKSNSAPEFAETGLFVSAAIGDTTFIEGLIKNNNTNIVKAKTVDGVTALHLATQNGHMDAATYLIEQGADVDARTSDNFTALHLAAQNGQTELVRMLVKKANLNAETTDGATSFHLATNFGHTDSVKVMLQSKRVNLEQRTHKKSTPLHLAAQNGHVAVVQALIEANAKIEAATNDGFTALHLAVEGRHLAVAMYLVGKKANLNGTTNNKKTALVMAMQQADWDMAVMLLEAGSDIFLPAPDGSFPLELAIRSQEKRTTELLMSKANGPAGKIMRGAALLRAVIDAQGNTVEALLKDNTDPDVRRADGTAAVIIAAQAGNLVSAKLLVKYGASIASVDSKGRTALHWASELGYDQVAAELIRNGASPDVKDHDKKTPVQIALEHGHIRIVSLLGSKLPTAVTNTLEVQKAIELARTTGVRNVADLKPPPPIITEISPASGTTFGGTVVKISGTNLKGATSVMIGGVAVAGFAVISPDLITATTGTHLAGEMAVAVTTRGGTVSGTVVYTYIEPPPPPPNRRTSIVTINKRFLSFEFDDGAIGKADWENVLPFMEGIQTQVDFEIGSSWIVNVIGHNDIGFLLEVLGKDDTA
jgi:ankyrin repeat protein